MGKGGESRFGEAKGEWAAHSRVLRHIFMVASLFPDSIQW